MHNSVSPISKLLKSNKLDVRNDKKGNTKQPDGQNLNEGNQGNDGTNPETPASKDNINSPDLPPKGMMPPTPDMPKK